MEQSSGCGETLWRLQNITLEITVSAGVVEPMLELSLAADAEVADMSTSDEDPAGMGFIPSCFRGNQNFVHSGS